MLPEDGAGMIIWPLPRLDPGSGGVRLMPFEVQSVRWAVSSLSPSFAWARGMWCVQEGVGKFQARQMEVSGSRDVE